MKQPRLKSRKLSRLPRKLLPMEPQSPKEVSNSPQPDVPDPRTWLQQPDQPPPRPPSPAIHESTTWVPRPPPQPVPAAWQSVDDGQIARQTAEHLQRGFAATSTGPVAPPKTLIPEARSPLHPIVPAQEQPVQPRPFVRAGVQDGGVSYHRRPVACRSRNNCNRGRVLGRERRVGCDSTASPESAHRNRQGRTGELRLAIHFLAALFFDSINERLEALRQGRSNSDEAAAEIAEYKDLKTEESKTFLGAALDCRNERHRGIHSQNNNFIPTGIKNWSSERHVKFATRPTIGRSRHSASHYSRLIFLGLLSRRSSRSNGGGNP